MAVRVLSLTTWFKVPEQGMAGYEVLSRASAFIARGPSPILLSSRHVTHPHHYRNSYYSSVPWLDFVSEEHLRYSVEVYQLQSKSPLAFIPLPHLPYSHPSRDVSGWTASATASVIDRLASQGFNPIVHPIAEGLCEPGMPVSYEGFVNKEASTAECVWDGQDGPTPLFPSQQELTVSGGNFLGSSSLQVFATSDIPLEMGMCGGPVTDPDGWVLGVLEGVVPPPPPGLPADQQRAREQLTGAAVFVECDAVSAFVEKLSRMQ